MDGTTNQQISSKMNQSQLPSSTPKHKRLNRDQRLQIRKLHDDGMNQSMIAERLGVSRRQVGYSIHAKCLSPKKARGRAPALSSEDVDQIEAFIKLSAENRQMSFLELAAGPFRYLGVSERVIDRELKKRGYRRYPTTKLHLNALQSEGNPTK